MPNYANSTLWVTGKGSDEFAKAVKDAEGNLSFGSIRPVPVPLMNDDWQNNKEIAAKNLKEHGQTGWYDWRVENWGTKWEAIDPYDVDVEPEQYTVAFSTAWSPPEAWVKYASKTYPHLNFKIEFHEEAGMYDSEIVQYKNGKVTKREVIANENISEDEDE